MAMDLATYRADFPYPAIRVLQKNPNYARIMLSNVGEQSSEASSVALYLYDQIITVNEPEISQAFALVKQTEQKHLEMFCDVAYQLGADPRLWAVTGTVSQPMRYWSPSQLSYTANTKSLLQNALALERATIARYERQTQEIKDDAILLLLRRVLVDESMHVEIFRGLLADLEARTPGAAPLPAATPAISGLPQAATLS
ncbi:MAG: ferritin-like domain-containing protein [Oscillospiraceae bacterium]|jgi:bacterioferritin|nr:ferritin-like domain-containing protein [Oscillospiraceae bacterium]